MDRKRYSWIAIVLGFLVAGIMLAGILLAAGGDPAAAQGQSITFFPMWQKKYCNGPGAVSGNVIDAATFPYEPPVTQAQVCFGGKCAPVQPNGNYTLAGLPPGQLVLTASASHYFPLDLSVIVRNCKSSTLNFAIYRDANPTGRSMRVYLAWRPEQAWPGGGCPGIGNGDCPNDLDTQLWMDPIDPGEIVYLDAGNETQHGDCDNYPSACLDVDQQRGTGPENLRVSAHENAAYYYGVWNRNQGYPGVPSITATGARVIVQQFKIDAVPPQWVETLNLPVPLTGDGDMWYVFSMDGPSGDLVTKNCITWFDGNPPVCP